VITRYGTDAEFVGVAIVAGAVAPTAAPWDCDSTPAARPRLPDTTALPTVTPRSVGTVVAVNEIPTMYRPAVWISCAVARATV